MTRTEELIGSGAHNLSGGEGHPFIKWGQRYGFVEGEVRRIWTGVYGRVAEILLSDFGGDIHALIGSKSEGDQEKVEIREGETFNVGLNLASLEDAVLPSQVGKGIHIAFVEWSQTKDGTDFRQFTVLGLNSGGPKEKPTNPRYLDTSQQARLMLEAEKYNWGPTFKSAEIGLKHLIGAELGINVEDVDIEKIPYDKAKKIHQEITKLPGKYEEDDDELPF